MDTVWGKKPVYISFWAIWCTNCVKELDRMNKLKDSLGIFIIAVNEDGERKKGNVLSFSKSRKWDFPILMDEGQKLLKSFGVTALPTSFLYDTQKKLVKRFTGFAESDVKYLKEFKDDGE
jgi:thiol-disulfide isomerase/thioredoxin